ncbi:MAG: acetyl-CoA carboxylase biotin carboxylase subunit [Microthrixaceae bacterium]
MFSKVLIANRGEIAVRVIRACRELGVSTVAVYSDLDRDALHVRLADEAYALGGQTAAESYIDADKILDVIERSGAEAVHPGYGFFSENSEFAQRITDLGVTFIGPPPAAIDVMGDKISARLAAEKVGVHGVPGTTDLITDPQQVKDFGAEFGYPVAIKAAYGGGGRGMKVVQDETEVEAALESAQREALAYFGRDECYMERFLTGPRHVEVQVMADTHGNVVYLGTRDCSAQRRHQKLIEEAPAADIPAEIIAKMGEAACDVARGCDYVNAGTVEFLYQDESYFYLEMNTRLQVEHPVTELVTGVDLVELQLRVASGEALPFTQDDVQVDGHAIECRINAEDTAEGAFLPSPGPITTLRVPSGFGTRWDGGYEAGDEISQYYDNLVGKLCVWGRTREVAIARMIRALEEFEVEGIATVKDADLAILHHPDFVANTHSTKWVEDTLDLTGIGGMSGAPTETADGEAKVRRDVDVEVNGKKFSVAMYVPESQLAAAPAGGATAKARPKRGGAGGGAAAVAGSGKIAVPMQGTIVKVLVEAGQTVTKGDPIVVLEAMKMENNVASDVDGTVTEISVEPGASVTAGQVVVVIDPTGD